MFTLLNRSTDYSLHSLLGFDIHKVPLKPFIEQEPSLTLISKLYTTGESVLAISKDEKMPKSADRNDKTINQLAQSIETLLVAHDYQFNIVPVKVHEVNDDFILSIADNQFTSLHDRYVFLNGKQANSYKHIYELVFELQAKNMTPVISFPEKDLHNAPKSQRFLKLQDRGCQFQIDLLSFTGHFGQDAKKISTSLLQNQSVQFVSLQLQLLDLLEGSKGIRVSKKVADLLDEQLFIS